MNALKNHASLTRLKVTLLDRMFWNVSIESLPPGVHTCESYILNNIWVLNLVRCHSHMTSICMANVCMCNEAPSPNSAPAMPDQQPSHFYQRNGLLYLDVQCTAKKQIRGHYKKLSILPLLKTSHFVRKGHFVAEQEYFTQTL